MKYGTRESPEKIENPLQYRYTGIRPYVKVLDENMKAIRADNIKIGDKLLRGGQVIGIVKHLLLESATFKGIRLARGTWVIEDDGVHAVTSLYEEGKFTFYQFLTENGCFVACSAFNDCVLILDDQETIDEEIHSWRDIEIQKEEA
jgi:hypothetical protein